MKTYDFAYIKEVGENLLCNDRILTCSDTHTVMELEPQHTHSFYEIQYVYRGEGVGITQTSNSFHMKPRFVSVFRPGIAHAYFSTEELELVNICFIPNELQKDMISYLEHYEFTLDEHTALDFETLYYLLNRALAGEGTQSEQKADIYLNAILNILSAVSHDDNARISRWSHLLYHISQNYATLTLKEAAKLCNCSESFFCRSFKRDFGETFIGYLDKIRLEKAKSLLKNTAMSVDEISRTVGFSYNTRFYRIFKAQTGVTPDQFRKNAALPQ